MKPMLVKSGDSVLNNFNENSQLELFPLHKNFHLLEECYQLINSAWPSSKGQVLVFHFIFLNVYIDLFVNIIYITVFKL